MGAPTVVALIPARAGSTRIPGKNVRPLGGHPLLAYSIAAARQSGVFAAVAVSTDDERYARIARHYGAEVPALRPAEFSGPLSPDIAWVRHLLELFAGQGRRWDAFSILRPTSPFRTAETIRRAWAEFLAAPGADSLRAVEPCAQHPGKMWVVQGARMVPLLPFSTAGVPWHSSPTQALPAIHAQNASLEIAWARVPVETGSIAGASVVPFRTRGSEGCDLNRPGDWQDAEELLRRGDALLPPVPEAAWRDEEG